MPNDSYRRAFNPWLVVLIMTACFAIPAQAAGIDRLQEFFRNLSTLQASFEQRMSDARFATTGPSRGNFVISRPNKFRWEYVAPYHQLIVADGKQIWIYDEDLEQVTVKPLGKTLGDTPALLLSGAEPLEKNFSLTEGGTQDGLQWVELTPRAEETGFSRIRLGFDATLRRMELLDALGQTTQLEFDQVQRNAKVDPKLFVFKPPAGVDVLPAGE